MSIPTPGHAACSVHLGQNLCFLNLVEMARPPISLSHSIADYQVIDSFAVKGPQLIDIANTA